jgi:membrane protein DedA with SNARE-associated domain
VLLESAGVPLPGEAGLFAASFAAAHGLLALPAVMGTGATAAVLGDNLGYWLGRRFGRGFLERHGRWLFLTHERLHRMDVFFERYGAPAVVLARFITGVRVAAAYSAGMARMRWWEFFTYNVIGGIAWATTVSVSGYALGKGSKWLFELTGTWIPAIAFLTLGFAIAYWLWRRLSREHGNPTAPRDSMRDGDPEC